MAPASNAISIHLPPLEGLRPASICAIMPARSITSASVLIPVRTVGPYGPSGMVVCAGWNENGTDSSSDSPSRYARCRSQDRASQSSSVKLR
jgi:hypothetical protein